MPDSSDEAPNETSALHGDFVLNEGYDLLTDGKRHWIAFPKWYPAEGVKMLVGAMKACQLGNTSVDYTIRAYFSHWKPQQKHSAPAALLHEITDYTRSLVNQIISKRGTLHGLPDHPGLFAAGVALLRLDVSFKAACLLCESGLFCEPSAIAKLILEQLAWAYAVHDLPGTRVFAVQPTKAFDPLKAIFPRCGTFYGKLNELSHIHADVHRTLVRFNPVGQTVILADCMKALPVAIMLAELCDYYGVIMETVYRRYFRSFEFIVDGKGVRIRPNRPTKLKLAKFKKRFLGLFADKKQTPTNKGRAKRS